tara:strand:- start:291 stop:842 length:552 start_codon:yes stop_codon:yes gene_type:complete
MPTIYIEKSHSKKDLIILFETLCVKLNQESTKNELILEIQSKIDFCKFNDRIKNITELLIYLKKPTNKQRPTTKQKTDIMFICKKIIKWSKNQYIYTEKIYNNKQQVFNDVMLIYKWGDLPSVRRACKFYNNSGYHKSEHINPIISEEVKTHIENNKIIKQQFIGKLSIRRATTENPIIIRFD